MKKVWIILLTLLVLTSVSCDPVIPLGIPLNADVIVGSFIGGPKDEVDEVKEQFKLDKNARAEDDMQDHRPNFPEDMSVANFLSRIAEIIGFSTRRALRNMLFASMPELTNKNGTDQQPRRRSQVH